jgi:hypothetical protein
MADSRQLDILKRLTTHLEGITTANGYPVTLAGRVFRGRADFGDSDPVPAISILEAPRPNDGFPADDDALIRSEDWVLLLQGWAEDNRRNPTDPVYELKACVEKRLAEIAQTRNGVGLYPDTFRLGGRIAGLRIGPGLCRPADQISPRAYFFLPLIVTLAVNVADPFVAG